MADQLRRVLTQPRPHTGLIAQRVRDAFASHGLDPWAFGLLCYDAWEAEYEAVHEQVEARIAKIEQGEDGNEVEVVEVFMEDRATGEQRLVHAAGDRFSIRYEEALAMEAAYQRRRAERIEARLAAIGA